MQFILKRCFLLLHNAYFAEGLPDVEGLARPQAGGSEADPETAGTLAEEKKQPTAPKKMRLRRDALLKLNT